MPKRSIVSSRSRFERLAAHRVDGHPEHAAFLLLETLHLRIERVLFNVGEHHVHPLGREASGEGQPHPARRARDYRRLACELTHDPAPPLWLYRFARRATPIELREVKREWCAAGEHMLDATANDVVPAGVRQDVAALLDD